MKNNYLKKVYKIIKFIFVNLIVYGIIVGVICGLIVTFLFNTPKISLINTIVKNEDDEFYCEFIYENKGQSPAINIEYIIKYAILYKNEIICNSELQKKQGKTEAGDVLACRHSMEITKEGKDIFKNSELLILCKVKYEDTYKIRNFINTRVLNNQYYTYRLAFYDISKKEKYLSMLTLEKRNEFKEIIDEWIEE
jgi:hypothetical protein